MKVHLLSQLIPNLAALYYMSSQGQFLWRKQQFLKGGAIMHNMSAIKKVTSKKYEFEFFMFIYSGHKMTYFLLILFINCSTDILAMI